MRNLKTIMRGTAGVAVAMAFGGVASAESAAIPGLPPEVSAMHALVGTWRGPATFTAGKDQVPLDVTMTCVAAAGGFAISCETVMRAGGQVFQSETDVFGWDSSAKKYHWLAVSSGGEVHDHVADPPASTKEAPTLTYSYSGKVEGKPYKETIVMAFEGDCSHFSIKSEGKAGGQTAFTLVGRADKQ